MYKCSQCDSWFSEFKQLDSSDIEEINEACGLGSDEASLYAEGEDVCPSCSAPAAYCEDGDELFPDY